MEGYFIYSTFLEVDKYTFNKNVKKNMVKYIF